MSERVKVQVRLRDPVKNKGTGTRIARRLRKIGLVPGVIYGHKQAVVPITVTQDDVLRIVKSPGHLADLEVEGASETVLIRDVQWDNLGKHIIHLDFARVSAEEMIETEVPLELRGHAPGVAAGGILEQIVHSVRVTCRAGAIPDSIKVDVSNLQVNEGVSVGDLSVPTDVTLRADPDVLLVHVVTRIVAEEPKEAPVEPAATQPEVIKPERKEKEKED
jgi:large subunit ribosomal protein L25